jgi:adenosylmethionine-8-amino-7-oxononanoate aminotransferase
MSGTGRCGTLHAWQHPSVNVVPDIQTLAKGLGGGYAPVAAMLINHRVANALSSGTGAFAHGHTYQGHPVSCAAALEVQRIIREDRLVDNVARQGELLGRLLQQEIGSHPHVGDVRGRGLFWGIEFVKDKNTKEPFPRDRNVANAVHAVALHEFGISLYPGNGSVDGVRGDHVLLAPAYTVTEEEIKWIVGRVKGAVERLFEELKASEEGRGGGRISRLLGAQPASKL